MTSTRRHFLGRSLAATAGLATAAGCSWQHGGKPPVLRPAPDPLATLASGKDSARTTGASVMQIVAHADDDLYFISPETLHFLHGGGSLTSVYLTAGESTGLGPKTPAVRSGEVPVLDRSHFAAARFYGLRRAYAQAVTGSLDSPWTRTSVALRCGTRAEVASLTSAPQVRMVLLNLLEAGDLRPAYRKRTLAGLVSGTSRSVPTLQLSDGPVARGYTYTRDMLLDALDELLTQARPTLVCTLDHDPEHKFVMRRGRRRITTSDHVDHTAAAQFTVTAVERYRPPAGAPTPVLQAYRGYANDHWPQTLDASTVAVKTALLTIYSGHGLPCPVRTGCGDHNVDNLLGSRRRFDSTQHRYQGDTGWLRPLPDGRLTAFAVISGRMTQWTQTAPGATAFGPPAAVPGGGSLVGQVSAVSLPDGRIRLFALRHGGMMTAPAHQNRAVVTAVQDGPGGAFGGWQNLGGPDGTVGVRAREMGLPYAAADVHGRLYVVARRYDRRLAVRTMAPGGAWGRWTVPIGPIDVQDGVCLVPRADGRLEIFAGTRNRLYRWTARNGVVSAARVQPLPVPACAPAALELPDGRLRLFLRPPASGDVRVYDETPKGWSAATVLRSVGGYGPVAVVPDSAPQQVPVAGTAGEHTASGGTAARTASYSAPYATPYSVSYSSKATAQTVAVRTDAGTVRTFTVPVSGAPLASSVQGGELLAGTSSLAVDSSGGVFLATLDADGSPHLAAVTCQGCRTADGDRTIVR